jgi:hypothetical protein
VYYIYGALRFTMPLTWHAKANLRRQGWENRSEALEKGFIQVGRAVELSPEWDAKEPIAAFSPQRTV